ncbi:MAG TPA: glycoside hydrolase family 2 TIM barrel-domain containing protein [Pseudonocardiaceae bacterium]|nr:glycoside hydrolase family 2 TIM barrel-domain containing protein [Pseudonocardiaceae bacterium]
MTDKPIDSETSGGTTRRRVLGGVGAGIGAAALTAVLSPAARAAGALTSATTAAPNRSIDFDPGWKFVLVNANGVTDPTGAYTDAPDPAFDDSTWRTVNVPHDWSIELLPVQSATTSSGTGFFPGGLAWYRKTFTLPKTLAGKRVSIEFDGVYMNSYVYLNGQLLGNHPYAYTGFSFDLTGRAHTDGVTPNVIAVSVQNQLPSSRWYPGSGIYRNVRLVVTDPVHVARHGTFVSTPGLAGTLSAGHATVQVDTVVANDGSTPAAARVVTTVTDAAGRVVGTGTVPVSVAAGQSQPATASIQVSRPTLWSTDNPYLYQLRTEIVLAGRVVDTTSTSFGIRYTTFDPAAGFSLNGKAMKLRGVDLHASQGPLGSVINVDALTRQMQLMKSMGVNALRTAHNPPAPELIGVCERLGIVMMVEAFDCWHTGKVAFDYHLYFDQWSESDIIEMVNAAKNSPAVVLWSIGNETPDTGLADGPPIAQRLIAAVRSVDTTRPVVMGSDQYRGVPSTGSTQDQILLQLDGLGLNYNTAMSVDGLHAKYPTKFFFESESSSETATRAVYQDPQLLNTGENYTPGKRATSSYDNNLASWTLSGEYSLKKDRDRVFFQGQFLWAGQDYIGEPTPYDVFPVKASFFGATDTAGFPKDMYHLFRSQWSTTPMVHILPMNWTDHTPGENVSVWVYANVDTVELQLNGKSLGVRKFDHKVTVDGRKYLETTEPTGDDRNFSSGSYTSPNGSTGKLHLGWTVPFQPGRLVAIASSGGRKVARDELVTAGPAHALRVTPDKRDVSAADRSLAFLTVEVVDAAGTVVPSAGPNIHFAISGPGRLVGVDNGRQESAFGYQAPDLPAYNGTAVAIVGPTGEPGNVTVVVTAPGLVSGRATLRASGGGRWGTAAPAQDPAQGSGVPAATPTPVADASYSGSPTTVPAAMLDGNPGTGWSNFYTKSATATLNAVSVSRPSDWVSVTLPAARAVSGVLLTFVTSTTLSLPGGLTVAYRTAHGFVPVRDAHVTLATTSGGATTVTFDSVVTDGLMVTMTSPTPGTSAGFLRIAEFTVTPG